jgi:hypothetical protein
MTKVQPAPGRSRGSEGLMEDVSFEKEVNVQKRLYIGSKNI